MAIGENVLGASDLPRFFRLANPDAVGIAPPEDRKGNAVRVWGRSLSGFQKEAIVRDAAGAVWRLVADEGAYLNGYDEAPCPLAFVSVGMAASFVAEIVALARIRGVELRALKLTLDNYYTARGSIPKRTMVGGAENVELSVEIDCDLEGPALNEFLVEALYASPVCGLMRGHHASRFKLAKNGRPLTPEKSAELGGEICDDPGDQFSLSAPADASLCEAVGETPKKAVSGGTAGAGTSLADEQDRRLNIGAVATLRADGMTELVHMQYSPHGTSFRMLSAEDGRAPSALALFSAGVGFCFMTQFGRFASMAKLSLAGYRIVQDIHFSLGGATGGTLRAGEADPVETHVFLETSEPDRVACEMLDMAEQTCFLHALCRDDVKVKLRVNAAG